MVKGISIPIEVGFAVSSPIITTGYKRRSTPRLSRGRSGRTIAPTDFTITRIYWSRVVHGLSKDRCYLGQAAPSRRNRAHTGNRKAACLLLLLIVYSIHTCLPADESDQEVTYEIQDDAYCLVIAAHCNHWVWRCAFPGGQRDPVVGKGTSYPLEAETTFGFDAGFNHYFSGIKHPPGIWNPVGIFSPASFRSKQGQAHPCADPRGSPPSAPCSTIWRIRPRRCSRPASR